MKVVTLACLSLVMVVSMSCRDERKTTGTPDNIEENHIQRIDRDIDQINNPGQAQTETYKEGRTDRTALFNYLNMTPEQIEIYETLDREYKRGISEHLANNESQTDRIERRTEYLRDILDDDQFQRYEEWLRTNPDQ